MSYTRPEVETRTVRTWVVREPPLQSNRCFGIKVLCGVEPGRGQLLPLRSEHHPYYRGSGNPLRHRRSAAPTTSDPLDHALGALKLATLAGKVRGVNGPAQTTGATEREVLLTRPVILLTLVAFAALFGFQLLLSVVPLYADEAGGGSSGAGLATAAFMLSTVMTQIQMPRILGRYGYQRALAAGLLFLGVPALFYAYAGTLAPILAVTLVRGVGFGIVTVVFAALIVELAPPHRRGEALGLLGVAITLPTIFCNALGLWLVGGFGFGIVFLLGGFTPLLGLGMIPWIRFSAPARKEGEESGAGFFAGLGRGPLRRIFILFAATTMSAGVVLTFLPLAITESGVFSAASALLVFGITTTASRWWAGRFGDRNDPRLLLAP